MATQFISTNKNYKRLYDAPLDPSSVYEDIESLREYLKDPTCYVDQLVGCDGKAYIIIEKDGVKDIKEIGTVNSSGLLFIGNEEPINGETVWIDTSEVESYTANVSDLIIEEFRTIIKTMNEEIQNLKKRVAYMEIYGAPIPISESRILLYGNDTIIVTDNNEIVIY